MQKKTKIVATISDRRCDEEHLKELFEQGVNVVRLNTAHQTEEMSLKVIQNIRKVSKKIAILVDTKGPEIRTTKVDGDLIIKSEQTIFVQYDAEKQSNNETIFVSYDQIKKIPIGTKILIDDGILELEVLEKQDDKLLCVSKNNAVIGSNKSVNIPSVHINLPTLSDKDRNFIHFAIKNDLDFIAHSFVRNADDVKKIKKILEKKNSDIKIIAKIENQDGVDNIDEILNEAYGIMIARGDLAIEIPQEKIPIVQKNLIQKAIRRRKPVITATQMLHTMIRNPRPTRAEVSDVANAIYDGTDAIMLSGETAYGKYPVESVKVMTSIAIEVEAIKEKFNDIPIELQHPKATARMLSKFATEAAITIDAKAIIADTVTGRTIRNLSAFRPYKQIFAFCYEEKLIRMLSLSYAVSAFYTKRDENHNFFKIALGKLLDEKLIKKKNTVVFLGGNYGPNLGASYIEISKVEDILS